MKTGRFIYSILLMMVFGHCSLIGNDSISPRTRIQACIDSIRQTRTVASENQGFDILANSQTVSDIATTDYTSLFNYTVGEISIQSGVSPLGVRTYNVPIESYPGVGGMTPQISLSYNSMQGNCIAGIGWSIAGLSSIVRTNKSFHYDGKVDGISQNADDAFILDGQRLIRVADENGAPCYRTAQGNIKVKAMLSDEDVSRFTVYYPDGENAIFTSLDAGQLVYPMTAIGDIDNNVINFTYICEQNNHLIQSITYNTGARIEFTYENRPDSILSYSNGFPIVQNKRLKKITSKWGTKVLGEYILSYTTINSASHLSSIGYTADGKSLNPLTFAYGDGAIQNHYTSKTIMLDYANITTEPKHNKHTRIVKGKFDYAFSDGILSFLNRNPYTVALVPDPTTGGVTCIIANKYNEHPNEKIYVTPDLEHDNSRVTTIPLGMGFVDALCMDLSGTQEDCIVRINNNLVGNTDQISFSTFRYSNEQDTCLLAYPTRSFNVGNAYSDIFSNKTLRPKHFYVGDFNGDGRQDMMVIICQAPLYDTSTLTQCKIYDIENNELIYSGTPFYCNAMFPTYWGDEYTEEQIENMDRLFVTDYNGDGKSDICLVNANGINTYEFGTTGTGITSCSLVRTATDLTRSSLKNRNFLIGDFNGDGLADFLLSPKRNDSDKDWKIYYSTGNGQFVTLAYTGPKAGEELCDDFIVQDVNCDGKSDLIECHETRFITYINTNNIPNTEISTNNMDEKSAIVSTNITSHNYFSHVLTLKDNKLVKYSFQNDINRQQLLTSMTNSFGDTEYTTYKYPYDENASYRVRPSDSITYPYVVLREKIPFVSSSYELVAGTTLNQNTYNFENLVIHRQGLGMCGMERSVTNGEQFITIQEYAPTLYGSLICDTTKSVFDGSLLSSNDYTYNVIHSDESNNAFVQVNLTNKIMKDHLQGFTTTSTYSYNEYGFPVTETVTTSDGYSTSTTQNVVHHTTGKYVLNVVNEKTVTTTRNGMTHTEKITFPEMYYDKPLKKYSYVNGSQVSYETFSYNMLSGLLSQKTIQSYSSPNTLTTSYMYDVYGRMTKETTPEQYTKLYTYNANGQVATYTDELGNTSSYTYDGLGRKIRTDFADGTWETIQYTWQNGSPTNFGALVGSYGYSVWTCHSNGRWERQCYNTRQQNVETLYGTVVDYDMSKYYIYDKYGNLTAESVPVLISSSFKPRYVHTYDHLNRLIKTSGPYGKTTIYSYNRNQVFTAKDSITTARTYDSQGNMMAVTDPTGMTAYTYRPDGQILSATVPCGLITTAEYDNYGRRTKLIDPSAGTTTFTYDESGNMASKTDGAGKQTLMDYDVFGRLTRKEYVGTLSTVYHYNEKGLLTGEYDSNDAVRLFDYDNFGRLIWDYQAIDSVDLHNLTRTYTYSSNGNLASVTYAQEDGNNAMIYGTEKFEYNNGHLKKTVFESASLGQEFTVWEIDWVEGHGLVEKATSGILTHYYEYDDFLNPILVAAEKNEEEMYIISYEYNIESGNLLSRNNSSHNTYEYFTYDNMNRLTGDGKATFSYDNATGNMTYNSRLGNIAYGQIQPSYRLTAIDPMFARGLKNDYMSASRQTATYNAMSRPASITEDNHTLDFIYNGRAERVRSNFYKKELLNPVFGTIVTNLEQRCYLGNIYERHIKENGNQRVILYLGGDAYSAPAAFVMDEQYGPHMAYICRDHLGSITHVVSEQYTKEYSYDAWGNLRDPESYNLYIPNRTQDVLYLGRGFTGHEHHGFFGLINMNARLYEPIVGRFISPDPFVQMPDNSQNFNRYAYCLNNPLRYTDESGEFIELFAAFMFGGSINFFTNVVTGNIDSFGDALASFAIGGLAGAAGAGVSSFVSNALPFSGFAGGVVSGAFGGFAGGFVSGAGQSWYNGANFWDGLSAGYSSGFIGAATGSIMQGLSNGFAAKSEGFNFWDGSRNLEVVSSRSAILDPSIDYIANAKGYESTAPLHDEVLRDKVFDTYQIQEGDYGITEITTKAPSKYGIHHHNGAYVNMEDMYLVDGVATQYFHGKTSIHISFPTVEHKNLPLFKAVAGHELLHAFQYYTIPNPNNRYMEAQAYKYTYEVCFKAGLYREAMIYGEIITKNKLWNINIYNKRPNTWGFK